MIQILYVFYEQTLGPWIEFINYNFFYVVWRCLSSLLFLGLQVVDYPLTGQTDYFKICIFLRKQYLKRKSKVLNWTLLQKVHINKGKLNLMTKMNIANYSFSVQKNVTKPKFTSQYLVTQLNIAKIDWLVFVLHCISAKRLNIVNKTWQWTIYYKNEMDRWKK